MKSRNDRGAGLPSVMALIFLIMTMYMLTLNLTLVERNDVLNYYYSSAALDLAESGVELGKDSIVRGGQESGVLEMGEFRQRQGRVDYSVSNISGGRYEIKSKGILSSPDGDTEYTTSLTVIGTKSGSGFTVESYTEN